MEIANSTKIKVGMMKELGVFRRSFLSKEKVRLKNISDDSIFLYKINLHFCFLLPCHVQQRVLKYFN